MTTCPTCGCEVRVISSDEGTSHYEPVKRYTRQDWVADAMKKVLAPIGLKDKNGREIYAGDIVRKSYGVSYASKFHPSFASGTQSVSVHVVEWSERWMGFRVLAEPMDSNFMRVLEVIGNKWEHSHLLHDH